MQIPVFLPAPETMISKMGFPGLSAESAPVGAPAEKSPQRFPAPQLQVSPPGPALRADKRRRRNDVCIEKVSAGDVICLA